jgi:hypothetical protein
VGRYAEEGEVAVSDTVKDLVPGSGIEFIARGELAGPGAANGRPVFAVAEHQGLDRPGGGDRSAEAAPPRSGELRRTRERPGGVDHEHDEGLQVPRAAAGDLHRRIAGVARRGLTGTDPGHAVGRPEGLFSRQHVHGLGARMAVHGRDAARGAAGLVDPEQVARVRDGVATIRTLGSEDFKTYFLELLAETLARAGQSAAALEVVAEALAAVETSGERFYAAELHRVRGELLLATGHDPSGAAECFATALAIARHQGARALERRALRSLAGVRAVAGGVPPDAGGGAPGGFAAMAE